MSEFARSLAVVIGVAVTQGGAGEDSASGGCTGPEAAQDAYRPVTLNATAVASIQGFEYHPTRKYR